MRIEREYPLELLLSFAKVCKNSRHLHCVETTSIDFTVLVIQCACPHAHNPRAHGKEIFRQKPLTELQFMVGRRSERVQRMYLEELNERMRSC